MTYIHLTHVDGVPWYDAKLPHRLHHCKVQTSGWYRFNYAEHCACGAVKFNNCGSWINKNSRRRGT